MEGVIRRDHGCSVRWWWRPVLLLRVLSMTLEEHAGCVVVGAEYVGHISTGAANSDEDVVSEDGLSCNSQHHGLEGRV